MNNFGVSSLQFYWRVKNNYSDKNIVPDFLPFYLNYNKKFDVIVQKSEKIVLDSLEKVYKEEAHIGNIQPNSSWGTMYKNDFLDFILEYIPSEKQNILEIGCGGCLILYELFKNGHQVVGLDPSIFSVNIGKKLGIPIIQDFFPSPLLKQSYDLIFHSDVLEHMSDPLSFLKHIYNSLNDNGIMILAIPDNEINFKNGDISIFLHQHMNFFDPHSLQHIVSLAGFNDVKIVSASFGGSLYCKAIKQKKTNNQTHLTSSEETFRSFVKKAKKTVEQVTHDVQHVLSDKKKTLGFYAPIRTLPYLAFMNLYQNFRFFDDTEYWHQKYLDGINIPIENFDDLKNNPVSNLFIMSPTFGHKIEHKVKQTFPSMIQTKKISDYFII